MFALHLKIVTESQIHHITVVVVRNFGIHDLGLDSPAELKTLLTNSDYWLDSKLSIEVRDDGTLGNLVETEFSYRVLDSMLEQVARRESVQHGITFTM